MQYAITTETAELIRAAAPAFGLRPSDQRQIVGPGIEMVTLDPFTAAAFERGRKASKAGAESYMRRIIGRALKGGK